MGKRVTNFTSTAGVFDRLLTGELHGYVNDIVVGRTLCQGAVYHDGLWYKVTLQTSDLEEVNELFGQDDDRPDNLRDPAYPDRIA